MSKVKVCEGIAGIECNGAGRGPDGSIPIPGEPETAGGQSAMRLSTARIEFDRLTCGFHSDVAAFVTGIIAGDGQCRVGVGQSGVGQAVVRIESQRLSVKFDCASDAHPAALSKIVTAPEVEIKRVGV